MDPRKIFSQDENLQEVEFDSFDESAVYAICDDSSWLDDYEMDLPQHPLDGPFATD